jgi:pimeloyl-ACP methyl ester carboxylesterase
MEISMPYRKTTRLVLVLAITLGFAGLSGAAQVVDGRFGPGALYRLVRPDNWNGRLLVYAHGFVSTTEPVALPAEAELFIDLVTAQGFAIAFSSYSENGWAVKDGAQRTHQLLGIFTSKFGPPSRVYVGGASMGGLIAIKLVEDYPGTFAGALPACSAAGGTRAQFDYQANVRALFDVMYPGVLPGTAGSVAPDLDPATAIVQPATAAIFADGGAGAATIAAIDQTPVPFSSGPELVQSVVTALGGHAGSFSQLVPMLPSPRYFDNQAVAYTSALLPPASLVAINAAVGRFVASPSALNYMAHYYEPSGQLAVPMLMLSTSRDPVLPGFHQRLYRDRVSAAGQSAMLVQRTIPRYGHCTFLPAEIGAAFADLVVWAELGIEPAP